MDGEGRGGGWGGLNKEEQVEKKRGCSNNVDLITIKSFSDSIGGKITQLLYLKFESVTVYPHFTVQKKNILQIMLVH